MSVYLFLFLLVCNTFCAEVCADDKKMSPAIVKSVELFKKVEKSNIKSPEDGESTIKEITADSYYSPSLLLTGDTMIAIVGVQHKAKLQNFIEIIIKYVKVTEIIKEKDIATTDTVWTTQFALQNEVAQNENNNNVVKSLLAAATDEKIYFLSVNYITPVSADDINPQNYELKLAVGTLNKNLKEAIVWNNDLPSIVDINKEFKEKLEKLTDVSFSGSAFLTKEAKVVFALVMQNKQEKTLVALLYLKKEEDTKLNLAYREIEEKCYPYFFPWEDKIIMFLMKCNNEKNKIVMEFDITNKNWSESKGQLTRLWGFLKDKHSFITVTIENERFLLFVEEKTTTETPKETYLWITDGSRVNRVGTITAESKIIFNGSLLYTHNELFALHKKMKDNSQEEEKNIVSLTRLKEQQESIAKILKNWKENKNKIENLCKDNAITKISYSTEGLVSFLSDNEEEKNSLWKDWYLNVDARITSGAIITNGFSFSGKRAGAVWPVGKQPNGLPYNFADSGFTLVATVSINKHTEKNDNSILGVRIDDEKAVELWCTNDGKWKVNRKTKEGINNKMVAVDVSCDQGETYQLVITLSKEDKNFLVYVDGQRLSSLTKNVKIEEFKTILYFYFGVDTSKDDSQSAAESHINVTNVLLYNRPFTSDECRDLKARKNENVLPDLQNNQPNISQNTEDDESAIHKKEEDNQIDVVESPEISTPPQKNTENISSHQRDSAVSVGGIIYVLLSLLLLGVDVCGYLVIA